MGHLDFLEECIAYFLCSCSLKLLKPAPHWAMTVGGVNVTRMNNFRICLLVGCDGLEKDGRTQDPSCKLCGAEAEDAAHFTCHCCAVAEVGVALLLAAPPTLSLPCFLTLLQAQRSS